MGLPTAYTNATLISYMKTLTTGVDVADQWTDYTETINDILLDYGVTSLADATDIRKVRSLAAVAVWRRVVSSLLGVYDFSADGGSYKRSQMLDNARKQLKAAQVAVAENGYGLDSDDSSDSASNNVLIGTICYDDAYSGDHAH